MRYGWNDFNKLYMRRTKNYYIKRQAYYDSIEDAIKDGHRIYELMKYSVKNNEKYKNISFIIGVSQTEGKTAIKTSEKTNGRPKYKVTGKKVKPHIHIACYGDNVPSFVEEICKKLNKNLYKSYTDFKNRGYKSKRLFSFDKFKDEFNGVYYVPYIFNQSEKFFSYGEMEFNKMKNDLFLVCNEEAVNEKIDNMLETIDADF